MKVPRQVPSTLPVSVSEVPSLLHHSQVLHERCPCPYDQAPSATEKRASSLAQGSIIRGGIRLGKIRASGRREEAGEGNGAKRGRTSAAEESRRKGGER
jgi:hypothetical protein